MKQETDVRYKVYFREFEDLGIAIERLQEKIKNLEYGKYNLEGLEIKNKLAFKILEGMNDFQISINKGIRFDSIFKDRIVEIYNIEEHQKKLDELMEKLSYDFD